MTPGAMRFTFLTAAVGVAAVSAGFFMYFSSMRCAAASANCNTLSFGNMTNGEKYLLVGLPLTIIIPLLILAWLMGRTPPPTKAAKFEGQHRDT